MALRYTGGGFGGALANIPARDLTDDEVTLHGGEQSLIASGLYAKPNKTDKKAAIGGSENKAAHIEATKDGE